MTRGPRQIPPAIFVPEPSANIDPLPFLWPAGEQIVRVYNSNSPAAASSFYAGTDDRPGRFNPFKPARKRKSVPVIYGADRLEGAISETVFHDVPVRGTRIVDATRFQHHLAVSLSPERDLSLADLTGLGLGRIGVSRGELIDSDPRSYPQTVLWARAIHDHSARFDGLMWVSRQFDRSRAVMLFGDRVTPDELPQDDFSIPTALRIGAGLDEVLALAADAGITVTGLE